MHFILMLVALFALLILGVPIAIALLISGVLGYMLTIGVDPGINALAQISYSDVNSFVIIAIPLYIFMGQIMLKGEAGRDLFDFAQRMTRRLPGGLVIAAILASAIFAAISGSSTATAATIGSISIPEMIKRGYDKRMAAGAVAVAGSLGILIPPSISLILYSLVTGASVGKLFLAGILPGLMLALLFAAYTVVRTAGGSLAPAGAPAGTAAADTGLDLPPMSLGMIGSLAMIVVVLGSIYAGLATPTEAAAIGVAYALILTLVVKRTLGARLLGLATLDSVKTSAMILMLIAGASVFGNTLSLLRVPQDVASWLDTLQLAQWQFLIAINALYLLLGMFMDASAAILVTVPILLPALKALDIDLIWFGVILVINMEIGAVTPPVGMNLFVVQSLSDDYTITDVLRGSLPYALMGLVGLALVILFPQIALWLPSFSR
ncbi:TRAP transporter large permease [Salinisphaera sp. LB1]|uniref:TRAP transporter large permease n=1 Tax=Salinisphaera sp. LB1 TaxID=2183911 RepID=UPI000D705106|nr:TRAP transporter large permease subunit [Salinisphaera sp. LB1]AWN14798.1 TRAP-type C4-dicarboxylate transport system, large permease component [Salinisphaera sp. LB1]